jgi:prevent-host-death family protein
MADYIGRDLRMKNMPIIDIHKAKIHLSKLVNEAAAGNSFVISKEGKAMVRVVPFNAPSTKAIKRLGFMAGQISVPNDFDRIHAVEMDFFAQ